MWTYPKSDEHNSIRWAQNKMMLNWEQRYIAQFIFVQIRTQASNIVIYKTKQNTLLFEDQREPDLATLRVEI